MIPPIPAVPIPIEQPPANEAERICREAFDRCAVLVESAIREERFDDAARYHAEGGMAAKLSLRMKHLSDSEKPSEGKANDLVRAGFFKPCAKGDHAGCAKENVFDKSSVCECPCHASRAAGFREGVSLSADLIHKRGGNGPYSEVSSKEFVRGYEKACDDMEYRVRHILPTAPEAKPESNAERDAALEEAAKEVECCGAECVRGNREIGAASLADRIRSLKSSSPATPVASGDYDEAAEEVAKAMTVAAGTFPLWEHGSHEFQAVWIKIASAALTKLDAMGLLRGISK